VSSTFGDPLRLSFSGGSFVRESLETPVGKVVKLLIGQVILWVQCKHGPESVRGRRRTTWSLWAHRLPRVAPQGQEHALATPRLVELTYQPEEQNSASASRTVGLGRRW